MEQALIKLVVSQGIFAVLFVYLLFYVLKENSKRGLNYQKIVNDLNQRLPTIEEKLELISKEITDPKKILGYLNLCFKHFKNFNIDKFFRLNDNFERENIENFEYKLISKDFDELKFSEIEFPRLSKIISDDMLEILQEKFIDKLTCKDISKLNNLSKQRISQKILKAKDILENEIKNKII